ncbi:MAG: hypothetical protein U0527_06410 [Candidatus Eisenbacteria bacterium]
MEEKLKPRFEPDPVIDAFKPGVDMSLVRENLKLTPEERLLKAMALQEWVEELRAAGRRARAARRKQNHA